MEEPQPEFQERSAFDVSEEDEAEEEEVTDEVDAALERAAAFQREKAKLKAQTEAFTQARR